MILLIDNYDSFVFNLARYLRELQAEVRVARNDSLSLDEIRRIQPKGIILSPGPCSPNEAGICLELVRELTGEIPILGVCLGHQAIAAGLGGKVIRSPAPMHGRSVPVEHEGSVILRGLPQPFQAGRYHSLLAEQVSLPDCLKVTAWTQEDHLIMGIEHRQNATFGVQFHPESILTEGGHVMLGNFLRCCGIEPSKYESIELTPRIPSPEEESGSSLYPRPVFW